MPGKFVFRGTIQPETATVDISDPVKTQIRRGEHQGRAIAHITDSKITVEFELEGTLKSFPSLVSLIENYLRSIIDPLCYLSGNSIDFQLTSVNLPNGEKKTLSIGVPEVEGLGSDRSLFDELSRILSLFDGESGNYLRSCLTDFRLAMDYPHETGFYCYRAAESIRKNFQGDEQSDEEAWEAMRKALNIDKEKLMYVKEFADERRHGGFVDISGTNRQRILDVTWDMIMGFVDHLDGVK